MKMNLKLKTLLVLSGVVLLSVPVARAQGHGFSGGGSRGSFAARPSLASRPSFASRGGYRNGGGSYYRGGYHHGGYGRYYYLGGVPYFYPFYGFGGFYGDGFYGNGFYGDGYDGGYAGGAYGNGSGYNGAEGSEGTNGGYGAQGGNGGSGPYEGRITNGGRNGQSGDQAQQGTGPSLPSAVQRQLSKRGYYKGTVDGQFGPASREALKRFQKSQGMKATGNIDEDTLDALGFTDKRQAER